MTPALGETLGVSLWSQYPTPKSVQKITPFILQSYILQQFVARYKMHTNEI
jgi:hypothetical protein